MYFDDTGKNGEPITLCFDVRGLVFIVLLVKKDPNIRFDATGCASDRV